MEREKQIILAMYMEEVVNCFKANDGVAKAYYADEPPEQQGYRRELFAEAFGRRQALGKVLKEVYDLTAADLQKIIDRLFDEYQHGKK